MLLPPSTKLGKVIFSQASVILSEGGESAPGGGAAWSGGCLVPGVPSLGGLPGWGAWPWGGAWSEGVPGGDPPGTATAVSGTHPAGMHSCFYIVMS